MTSLELLNLDTVSLTGSIPTVVGLLTLLSELSAFNNELEGALPSEMGMLSLLRMLDLSINKLDEPIPLEVYSLSNLEVLSLGRNNIQGPLASQLGNLKQLKELTLRENDLSGRIPSDIGLLTSLEALDLRDNQLSGHVPSELGLLTKLTKLILNDNDGLLAPLPWQVERLHEYLDDESKEKFKELELKVTEAPTAAPNLGGNEGPTAKPSAAPTSSIYAQLLDYLTALPVTKEGTFDDVQSPQYRAALWLADEDSYLLATPHERLNFSDPRMLQRYAAATLYYATSGDKWKLCGANSPACGDTIWLTDTDVCTWFSLHCEDGKTIAQINFPATGNDLTGTLPAEISLFTGLARFMAPENSLKGDLDLAFGGLSTLETLALPGNHLEGTIPTGYLENNPNLALVDLGGNQFTGPIPVAIAAATKLTGLQLNGNLLTGAIPSQIGILSLLKIIQLQTNKLVGEIPDELFSLTRLHWLSIRENEGITGTINPLISKLTGLGVLQLGFTGMGLPEELFVLTDLSEMNLEGADFSGTIPEDIQRLNASLMDLFLNDNGFTGSVPEAFDYLTALETLQIQGNQLTGSISPEVCSERGLRFQQLATVIVDCAVECDCCDNCEE